MYIFLFLLGQVAQEQIGVAENDKIQNKQTISNPLW